MSVKRGEYGSGKMEARGKISRRHFVQVAASLPAGLLVGMAGAANHRKDPFADAIALWHMGEADDRAGGEGGPQIHGNVKIRAELSGAEYEASLRRGGDGKVAEFR